MFHKGDITLICRTGIQADGDKMQKEIERQRKKKEQNLHCTLSIPENFLSAKYGLDRLWEKK